MLPCSVKLLDNKYCDHFIIIIIIIIQRLIDNFSKIFRLYILFELIGRCSVGHGGGGFKYEGI